MRSTTNNISESQAGHGATRERTGLPDLRFLPRGRMGAILKDLKRPGWRIFLDARQVWLAAAFIMGLNIAIVFSPTLAPKVPSQATALAGGAAASLASDLERAGLPASATARINKEAFSVPGTLLTLAGDNVQVFEYSTRFAAMKEASALAEAYRGGQVARNPWEKSVSIYTRDAMVVFYMGNNESILNALTRTLGAPLLGGASAWSQQTGA